MLLPLILLAGVVGLLLAQYGSFAVAAAIVNRRDDPGGWWFSVLIGVGVSIIGSTICLGIFSLFQPKVAPFFVRWWRPLLWIGFVAPSVALATLAVRRRARSLFFVAVAALMVASMLILPSGVLTRAIFILTRDPRFRM